MHNDKLVLFEIIFRKEKETLKGYSGLQICNVWHESSANKSVCRADKWHWWGCFEKLTISNDVNQPQTQDHVAAWARVPLDILQCCYQNKRGMLHHFLSQLPANYRDTPGQSYFPFTFLCKIMPPSWQDDWLNESSQLICWGVILPALPSILILPRSLQ